MTIRLGLYTLHRLRDHFDRLTLLKVRRVQQALLLVWIEQGFGRLQLEDLFAIIQSPAMGSGASHELLLVSDGVM